MLNFQLMPGDKYDGRCAEIYITEKQFLVYHCSVCEEIYATFNELLSHITKDHYENTKEYSAIKIKGVETVITQETQLEAKELFVKTKNSNKIVDANLAVVTREEQNYEQSLSNSEYLQETPDEKVPQKTKDMTPLFNSSKHFPQHKKSRNTTGSLKNNAIGRSKINTRYQTSSSEERKYVCGICGFAFKDKYNLRGHLLRHSNQKNFSCSICPKKFFTKVELRLHEYRHKEERSYLCNHCGMGFLSSVSLMQHIRKHHSLRLSFKREQSNKPFSNFYQLKDEQLVHSEEYNFQCKECPLIFKCNKTLSNHLKMHENRRENRCENCDLDFTDALSNYQRKKCINECKKGHMTGKHIMKDTNEDKNDSM